MIPKVSDDMSELVTDFEEEREPSKTYKLDLARKRIVGYVDDRDAVEQAIYKIMGTERYDHLIYSWNYGSEISKLFGRPIPYVFSELKRLITEALTQDDRILSVDAFSFSHIKNKVIVSFAVQTIYGDIETGTEVAI
ncbi:DUF2634 domain-containing protein [Sporosarcina sp. Te-1]|uniref:DUF2634 domain-containing protein n=1 Tax=Sporosarcina sp. Te-1 TaxID=2818390 RepID=UPI001A9ECDBB|nr:DUF2634 domain-containing protein [Sporosarcina sp. Te-1]QTD40651.1 DUF2634 domain-containing protein [Sporosarcina sp. Te-1]